MHRTFHKRVVKKRVVSRSFRIPPNVDRELDRLAGERQWTKSFLIRDILISYITYHKAKAKHDKGAE